VAKSAVLLGSPARIPTPGTLSGRPERCGDWLWSSRYSQTLFFPALIQTKHLVFSPMRKNRFSALSPQLSTVISKKTMRFKFADFLLLLVLVWFQKIKQVFGFLQLVYVQYG
jgi:hypothetical protein